MTTAAVSACAILAEQVERTRQNSKADIERFIEECELKITSLEWQIRTLRDRERSYVDAPQDITSQIHTLVELRDRERLCADSLRYIISPINTLPTELLVEIFRFAIDEETHIKDAYRISQICSEWREIAHATPLLWTQPICVDLGSRKIYGREHYVDGLESWLARSAPLPVPVLLKLGRGNIDPRALEVVLGIAPRIRSLHCGNYFPLALLSQLAGCRLDSLEELEMGLADDSPNISESPALTMVPRLRKLTMTLYSDEPHVLSPWPQIIDLTLDSNSPNLILDILAQCTGLTHTSICTSGWPVYVAAQLEQPPLAFSHLHTLSLEFGYPQHVMGFLGSLSAPVLETLHLNFLEMQDKMQSKLSLAPFLMQSPNITRLEIRCGQDALTSHELIVALEHTVHLTHLKLVDPYEHSLDDALIDALTYNDDVATLVPNLCYLVLDNIDEDGISTAALERLFVSRCHLELWGKFSKEFVDSMETL
ncbi:F-box domain-containing protein [Mycena sanguinolenta]|uniref:F-box domain-containing protein n=1 Tax=Mycena sanguinolenta TaxID=230812 RepID=A0A8H6YAQ8_9AGAR|nr:F-box domain-containing protein [Mycena sanguinolenta]